MSLALSGIGISKNIAIGKAYVLQRGQLEIPEYVVPKKFVRDEIDRFKGSLKTAVKQLQAIKAHIPAHTPADIKSFIDTHLLMLDDSMLARAPIDIIEAQHCNAEWALKQQRDALVKVFEEMDDPYLRTRKDDIDHVVNRIQGILLDETAQQSGDLESRLKGYILIADDLTPADTVLMQHYGIAGFITEYGGPTSHTSILARSLNIPAIVGVKNAHQYISDDEIVIIDGDEGVLLADVDEGIQKHYRKLQREQKLYRQQLNKLKGQPAITSDKIRINLHANIELPEDLPAVKRAAAEGVGLYRTEFLYMNRTSLPDEKEQFKAYQRVVKSLNGAPVTIRTLDLGADKQVDGAATGPIGANPALGLRAIRLCLKDPNLFIPQIRAILRASAYGNVRIMIPMLTNVTEMNQVLQIIEDTKHQLRREKIRFDDDIAVGGMIEVPAAAIVAGQFAKHLDFLSIGTNDLIQYTLAIDRIDDEVSYLYDPVNPAVLQLIYMTIQAGNRAKIPISMCGEMAGDPTYTRLLLGLGLREFSMHPATLLEVKRIVKESNISKLSVIAKRALKADSQSKMMSILAKLNQ